MNKLKNYIYQHWLLITVGIISIGIGLDIFVNRTGKAVIIVTENSLDYIFSAIVSIGLISFSIIALLAGMLSRKYCGYRLVELLTVPEFSGKINFKHYSICSLLQILLAAVMLIITTGSNTALSFANGLVFVLIASVYLAGSMIVFVLDLMTDEEGAYYAIRSYYQALQKDKQQSLQEWSVHLNRIFTALEEAITMKNIAEKNQLFALLKEILIMAVSIDDETVRSSIMITVKAKLQSCSEKLSSTFGYEILMQDIIELFSNLPDEVGYLKADLFTEPVKQLKFYDEYQLEMCNYSNQLFNILKAKRYEADGLTRDELVRILYKYFDAIFHNTKCNQRNRNQLLDQFLSLLSEFEEEHTDNLITVKQEVALQIIKYNILQEENEEDRRFIFSRLIRHVVCHNRHKKGKQYLTFLSVFYEVFYRYIYEEVEIVTKEHRDQIKQLFQTEISDEYVQRLKAVDLLENKVRDILSGMVARIPEDVPMVRHMEVFPDYMALKSIVWAEGNACRWFFLLYCVYYDQTKYKKIEDYLSWDKLDLNTKNMILSNWIQSFEIETGLFTTVFLQKCQQASELFQHTRRMDEVQQKTVYENIINLQSQLVSIEEKIPEVSDTMDKTEIMKCLYEVMLKDDLYGWREQLEGEYTSKVFSMKPQIERRENQEEAIVDWVRGGIPYVLSLVIKSVAYSVKSTYDQAGIDMVQSILKDKSWDLKNFSYVDNLSMLSYQDSQPYKALREAEEKLTMISTPGVATNFFAKDDTYRFSISIVDIKERDLTESELIKYVEDSERYREYYYVDGKMIEKSKAIEYVKRKYHIYECQFEFQYMFTENDIVQFV